MTELHVELVVTVVAHLDDAVLDPERVAVVFAQGMLVDLDGPARKILPIEQRMPFTRVHGGRPGHRIQCLGVGRSGPGERDHERRQQCRFHLGTPRFKGGAA
jgi:hypothetical protein